MKDKAENIITTELAKQNVTEAVIAKLKQDYLPLTINGIEDKEGYKKVHDARIVCRDHRVLAEKICKAGREDAVKEQKAWIAKEKEIVAKISEVEQYLKKQEELVDAEIEAKKIKAERLLKLPGRKEQMVGFEKYLGQIADFIRVFTQQEIGGNISDEIIMRFTDEQWTQCILLAKEAKLNEQQKAIDEATEVARLNRLTERTNILYGVSVSMRSNNGRKEFIKGDVHYSEDEIADMSQEQWDKVCSGFKSVVIPDTIKQYPKTPSQSYSAPIREEAKDISDEEKLFNYATALENVPAPDIKTEAGRTTLYEASALLDEAIELLRK